MSQSHRVVDTADLPGRLIIGSAPSGAGKNSIFSQVLKLQQGDLVESVSCTTRSPRPGELEGRDYYFITLEEFEEREREGYFLEAAGGHDGRRYGTPIEPVLKQLRQGIDVLLVIEVDGAGIAHERIPEALMIFIMPAGKTPRERTAQLEAQLRSRGTDTEEKIRARLGIAVKEMDLANTYQHIVVNAPGKLDEAIAEVNNIINEARRERRT